MHRDYGLTARVLCGNTSVTFLPHVNLCLTPSVVYFVSCSMYNLIPFFRINLIFIYLYPHLLPWRTGGKQFKEESCDYCNNTLAHKKSMQEQYAWLRFDLVVVPIGFSTHRWAMLAVYRHCIVGSISFFLNLITVQHSDMPLLLTSKEIQSGGVSTGDKQALCSGSS